MKKFFTIFRVMLLGVLVTPMVSCEKEIELPCPNEWHSSNHAVDLGLSVKWACCNVGANSPEDYGDYFAWGETDTKSNNCDTYGLSPSELESQGIIDLNGNLTITYDAATANWGEGWRVPTSDEIKELCDKCSWNWTSLNGVNGYKITGSNGNFIFLPAAGRYNAGIGYLGFCGYYWSATLYENDNDAFYLYFGRDGGQNYSYYDRRYGRTIRPVTK